MARQTIHRTPKKDYDYMTTARMSVVGGVGLAPCLYGWYRILDRLLVGKTMRVLVKKVIVDQLVAGSMGVSIFYVGECSGYDSFCVESYSVLIAHIIADIKQKIVHSRCEVIVAYSVG